MKEKKAGRIIIITSFVIIICLSNIIWLFVRGYFDTTNHENRKLAEKPALSLENYEAFPSDYTSYFNDHLQFRNELISINTAIDYFCFKKAANEDVIIGNGNWLFYSSVDDGDSISCYQGKNLYTNEELEAIAQNCIAQRDFLSAQGREFVIFIAPNKERIYSEHMPSKYGKPSANYGTLQIYNYLRDNTDIRIVYPYDELIAAKRTIRQNLYYKTDTHWNYIGAYIGATALMDELGITMPPIDDASIVIESDGFANGDLASMLNLNRPLHFIDKQYVVEGYDLHNINQIEWNWEEMIRYHATAADPRTIYVIRDSFSDNLAPYIGSQFNKSYLRHNWTYSLDDLEKCDPDIVVYETVERYADKLASFSIQK